MRIVKKIIGLFLLVFIINVLPYNAAYSSSAENTAEISVGKTQAKIGDTVYIPITISGNTGFADLEIEIDYDGKLLELNGIYENNVGASFTPAESYDIKPYNMAWTAVNDIEFNGILATLSFRVIADSNSICPITVSFYKGHDGKNVDGIDVNYSEDYTPILVEYIDGYIQIECTDVNVSIDINNITYAVDLCPDRKTDGIIAVSLYTSDNRLIKYQVCPSAADVEINFGTQTGVSYANVMLWENMVTLKPLCIKEVIHISN